MYNSFVHTFKWHNFKTLKSIPTKRGAFVRDILVTVLYSLLQYLHISHIYISYLICCLHSAIVKPVGLSCLSLPLFHYGSINSSRSETHDDEILHSITVWFTNEHAYAHHTRIHVRLFVRARVCFGAHTKDNCYHKRMVMKTANKVIGHAAAVLGAHNTYEFKPLSELK